MNTIEALLLIVLLGLGTARAAAIIAIDEISEPIRDRIFMRFPPEDNADKGWFYQCFDKADKEERAEQRQWDKSWRHRWIHRGDVIRDPTFIGKLLGCHKCVAIWVAAGNTALYFLWEPGAVMLNVFLAAALVSAVVNKHLYDD